MPANHGKNDNVTTKQCTVFWVAVVLMVIGFTLLVQYCNEEKESRQQCHRTTVAGACLFSLPILMCFYVCCSFKDPDASANAHSRPADEELQYVVIVMMDVHAPQPAFSDDGIDLLFED